MEVLKFTMKTDKSGYLNLTTSTQLAPSEVDIVITVNPVSSIDKSQLKYNFSDLVGQLTWQEDAVSMQRVIRNEW
jgi:hypothetical protein